MKRTKLFLLALLAGAAPVSAQDVLADLGASQLATAKVPEGVVVEVVEVGGTSGVRVTYSGTEALSVVLAEVPCDGLDNTRVLYRAVVSGEGLAAPAYLELNAVVGGQTYFSRALNEALTGTMAPRESATPFFLQTGQRLETAQPGVRFEGPGAVTLSQVQLLNLGPPPGGLPMGAWVGIAGATVGILTSIWACMAAYFAWQGRGRGPVLGVTVLVAMAGVASVAVGLLLYGRGVERDLWYGLILLGSIVLVNFGIFYGVLRWLYGKAEARRMVALDM